MPNLIRRDYCVFIASQSTFNNIIIIREVAHSTKHDMSDQFMMLIKGEWNVILATLTKLRFALV